MELDKLRLYAIATWADERFGDSRNSALQENADGELDARFGKLDSYLTVDVSAHYAFAEGWEAFVSARNVFDETYVTSRIPHGPARGGACPA